MIRAFISSELSMALAALGLAVIATCAGGCADADEVVPPDGMEPPVIEPQPYACTVGAVEDWGEGITSSIAGTDEGYAVLYAEWHDRAGQFRTVAPDGTPTSPLQAMPIDGYDVYAQVTKGLNGYLVEGADIGTYGGLDARSIYTVDQSGEILRSDGPHAGSWGFGLASGLLDWAARRYGTQPGLLCPSGQVVNAYATGPAGTIAKIAPVICLYEAGYTVSDVTVGFGSYGEGFALGLHHYRQVFDPDGQPQIDRHLLQIVVYDGETLRTVNLHVLNGVGSSGFSRIIATDDGYAVRWGVTRIHDENGMRTYEDEAYLTFLDPTGNIIRTTRIEARVGDIAWNGREIGEASYDTLAQAVIFTRYGKDGLAIERVPVAVTSLHYMSWPRIASADGGFAIVWNDNDLFDNERPHLRFAPIACR